MSLNKFESCLIPSYGLGEKCGKAGTKQGEMLALFCNLLFLPLG